MIKKFLNAKVALALLSALSITVMAMTPGQLQNADLLALGKVEGTITLPLGGQLNCSNVLVSLYRPGSSTKAGPVTPQPSGSGKCSYSITAFVGEWTVYADHTNGAYDLGHQVLPSKFVKLTKGQVLRRNINIGAVLKTPE